MMLSTVIVQAASRPLCFRTAFVLHANVPAIAFRHGFGQRKVCTSLQSQHERRAHTNAVHRTSARETINVKRLPRTSQPAATMEEDAEEDERFKFDQQGRIVLYRGPPAMKTWLYYFIGSTFVVIGLEMAYNIYHRLTWPLYGTREDGTYKPALVEVKRRTIAATCVGFIGICTGFLFFMVPSASVTRLTLDLPHRQLVIRTAVRAFAALPPRSVYPTALRRTAERHGYYLSSRNDERVVPLTHAFRIRGSALESVAQPSITLRASTAAALSRSTRHGQRASQSAHATPAPLPGAQRHQALMVEAAKRSIEIKVGQDRLWYTVEASGGRRPTKETTRSTYARFFARLSYWMRGSTDWSDVQDPPTQVKRDKDRLMDAKESWFLRRRTFDDVIPLVKRK